MAPHEPWLTVVGIDAGGPTSLAPGLLAAVEAAEVLAGGERHHALFAAFAGRRLVWQTPLEESLDELEGYRGQRVVVLASGDPLCFGIGTTLSRRFGPDEMRILPAPSSPAMACARLHWAVAEVDLVSLHRAPPSVLVRHLWPGRRLIVLARDETTPPEVQRILCAHGFGASRMWILEHLGGERERIVRATADQLGPGPFARLNLIALECVLEDGRRLLGPSPGLPDAAFESDGMLTRSEIRAITLARLRPGPGHLLIDVGAGSGSIAIEWLRAARQGRAVALERAATRCAIIERNAAALGTPELQVVQGEAPECLERLESADALFVGGGLARPGMLESCFGRLRPGGRLVANAVTLDGEQALAAFHRNHGGELVRIALARLEPVGRLEGWRPAMPVTQLAVVR